MTLSTAEIESCRFHLGYGNVAVGALPYTQDGFWSVFDQIVSPYLGTGTETSATTTVTANSTTAVTPDSMTGIDVYGQLVVDVADQVEAVVVKAADATTFTAYFSKAHSVGYPITTMCGKARLRVLLHDADVCWRELGDPVRAATAGLKSVDKNDVVWQTTRSSSPELTGRMRHYQMVCRSISALTRVPLRGDNMRRQVMLEAF